MLRIYHRERAGRPIRIVWVLEEIGAPYELKVMDREEGRGEKHLVRHPLGRVPVLEDEEGFVFESAALCLHVADMHPEAELIPPLGSHSRALVYQWVCFAPGEIEPPLLEIWQARDRDPEHAAKEKKRFFAAASAVEAALGNAEFLVDGRFSVADVMVATALMFTPLVGLDDQLTPALNDYLDHMRERPAYQRALKQTYG